MSEIEIRDEITHFGKSLIQHGRYNNRLYLVKLHKDDFPHIIEEIKAFVSANEYVKIIAKVPIYAQQAFLEAGFGVRASVPGFYNGTVEMCFLAKFFDQMGKIEEKHEELDEVLENALAVIGKDIGNLDDKFKCKKCGPDDIGQISVIYKEVFKTYPFPIDNEKYILQTMTENIWYYGIFEGDKLVAVSSAEIDFEAQNVEMTDFATLPDYRGNGFAAHLLKFMEEGMRRIGIKLAYTVARAISQGMNNTFAKIGYQFDGILLNNTNISGSIESMNIWHKNLHHYY